MFERLSQTPLSLLAFAAAALVSTGASATITDADLAVAGDGRAAHDSDSGLQWLDLTETLALSWNQVDATSFVTVDGFRHATSDEVTTLFLNAGFLTVNNVNNPLNDPANALLQSVMGCTQFCGTVNETGRGFAEYSPNPTFSVRPNYHSSGLGSGAAIVSLFSSNFDLVDPTAGHFLVRNETDGDGHPDDNDNCINHANAQQIDSNVDGYGNVCDSDFDQNDMVGASDLAIMFGAFGSSLGDANYLADADCDGNDVIGATDFSCLLTNFGQPPGPSSHGCAGTIPCPLP